MAERLGTALLLLLALPGCAIFQPELQSPEVSLSAVTLESLGLTEQVFRARLIVSNPNSIRLKVADAFVTLQLGGIDLGRGETISGVSIPARGQDHVDIRIVTNLWTSAPQLWSRLSSGDTTLDYRVNGFVNLGLSGLARLRIDESGQFDANELL